VNDVAQAGWDVLAEYAPVLDSPKAAPAVRQAYADLKTGAAVMAASTQKLVNEWSANKATQHVKDPDQFHADRRAVIAAANDSFAEGRDQARQAYAAIRSALRAEVLPKIDEKRELADRQLFDLALGNDTAAQAGARALRLAKDGDEVIKAVLVSPYGKMKLKAAGVHERTIETAEDTVIATSDHPSAKVAAGIGRLENVMIALDTAHRMKSARR
jgi:hypothetical protein